MSSASATSESSERSCWRWVARYRSEGEFYISGADRTVPSATSRLERSLAELNNVLGSYT
jgi:hypothetical protein